MIAVAVDNYKIGEFDLGINLFTIALVVILYNMHKSNWQKTPTGVFLNFKFKLNKGNGRVYSLLSLFIPDGT